jgi:TRAP-type C4-dicarboxylate transport system substrate-binding protein
MCVTTAACGGNATGSSKNVQTIRLSVDNPPGNARDQVEKKFAELVAQKSGGRLKVQIYYSGALGGTQATAIQAVRAGGAEMAIVGTANFAGIDKRWNMFDLPFLFAGPDGLYKYMASPTYQKLVAETSKKDGLRYVFPFYSGWRQLVTTKQPVHSLAEERGLKLRTTASQVEIAYDRAFAAKPTSLAFNETYVGLKQGLVDGLMIGYTDLTDFKMADAVKYGTTLNVAPELVMAFMRQKFFDSLAPELQKAVADAGAETDLFAQKVGGEAEQASRKTLQDGGMKIFDPPTEVRAEWMNAAQPVYSQFTDILAPDEAAEIKHSAGS